MAGRMKIIRDEGTPTEVLMDALSRVEGATKVLILIEKEESLVCKTNCTHQEIKWLLDQAQFITVADMFGMLDREGQD